MSNDSLEDITSYIKIIGAVILCIVMGIYLINRSDKPRADFIHHKGRISYLLNVPPNKLNSDPRPKNIYLKIEGLDKIFELFIGTDKGDFSPEVNRLTEMSVGEEVEIFYEETYTTKREPVNGLLQYLDRSGQLIYHKSKVDKYIGYFLLGSSGFLISIGLYMKSQSN